jgi:hypothetical protein
VTGQVWRSGPARPELAARRTAAAAALADIERSVAGDENVSAAAWAYRCGRLAAELRSLLAGLDAECPDSPVTPQVT